MRLLIKNIESLLPHQHQNWVATELKISLSHQTTQKIRMGRNNSKVKYNGLLQPHSFMLLYMQVKYCIFNSIQHIKLRNVHQKDDAHFFSRKCYYQCMHQY